MSGNIFKAQSLFIYNQREMVDKYENVTKIKMMLIITLFAKRVKNPKLLLVKRKKKVSTIIFDIKEIKIIFTL